MIALFIRAVVIRGLSNFDKAPPYRETCCSGQWYLNKSPKYPVLQHKSHRLLPMSVVVP